MVNITHSQYGPTRMQYILAKGDIITYAIQLFHSVQCIWLKGQIQAMVFMTVFALYPEAIIRGRLL